MSPYAIQCLPLVERPRERLRDHGPRVLTAVELVAILLGAGAEGRSALDVSRELLAECQGSLRRLATQPIPVLTGVRGVGPARAVTLHAALELGRRMMTETHRSGVQIHNAQDIYDVYADRLNAVAIEEFRVVVLDAQHRIDSDFVVSSGLLDATLAHPREVFRQAIAQNAVAIVLVHNHPSGDPIPSEPDRVMTRQLMLAGEMLGIPVLDHVIIGRGRFTSFAEHGILI